MNNKDVNKIFLSYAWANTGVANEIDAAFRMLGIIFIRDVRDVKYKTDMKKFMSRVRESDYVLTLISDEYLRSENCLFEVMELMKDDSFKVRTLQIILENAKVFDVNYRLQILEYWKNKKRDLTDCLTELGVEYIGSEKEQLKRYSNICNSVGEFMEFLVSENSSSYKDMKSSNYKEILDHIGFSDELLFKELLRISGIEDKDEREDAAIVFMHENPSSIFGYVMGGTFVQRPQQAIVYLNKALEFKDDVPMITPIIFYNRGFLKNTVGDFPGAINDYSEAITLFPYYDDALGNRGLLKFHGGDIDGALEDYNKAIEINPSNPKTYYNRGILKSNIGEPKEALLDYDIAIEIDSNYILPYYNRGCLKLEAEDYLGAIDDFSKVIEVEIDHFKAYSNRADARCRVSDFDGAIADYDCALKIDSSSEDSYINRGVIKSIADDLAGALADYNKAIAINNSSYVAYGNRANLMCRQGRFPEALIDYNKAIEINPEYAKAYANRGGMNLETGNEEAATNDFKRAKELDPNLVFPFSV